MDRVSAMLILLVVLVSTVLMVLALFAVAPVFCSCIVSLLYTLYFFLANEESGVHHAQEFENRFWTIFAVLFSTALFFAKDSPIAFGRYWSPSLGFTAILLSAYGMHTWDRHMHRLEISRQVTLRRTSTGTSSLNRLKALGIPVEDQLALINSCLKDIDQLLIPSTINNMINLRFVMRKEREIINVFEECDARALNYLISHVQLGLVFYKIKDHRNFSGQHRTELIQLLAVDRLPILTVMSRVIVLHALQGLKLRANPRSEYWVRNILLCTKQDDLSELKTLTDAKGVYLDMNKLLYDDIKSETIRQDILGHIRREAAVQQAHMQMGTKKAKIRKTKQAWRKVLSDVDDTLFCSGGSYPAGVDKRYGKKVVYPGVLAFYRELDLGTQGPEEWPDHRVGNLVFLSARPHFYKDVSEKHNFAKFEKLQMLGEGRKGMHTVPSLLAGDIASGRDYIVTNDMEPLAKKKFDNFKRYVSIYPEFTHVFVCDNGQGDVRAGELMFDSYPYEFEALYVHVVKDVPKTHGYAPERWRKKGLQPCFFQCYPEAALDAATRDPPLIRASGLYRVCHDAVKDFHLIQPKQWPSPHHMWDRRAELNQAIWKANQFLEFRGIDTVPLIEAQQLWEDGQKVRTPYGIATIKSFDPVFDMYEVELDWRPLGVQVAEHLSQEKNETTAGLSRERVAAALETVVETEEVDEDSGHAIASDSAESDLIVETPEYDIVVPAPPVSNGEQSTPTIEQFAKEIENGELGETDTEATTIDASVSEMESADAKEAVDTEKPPDDPKYSKVVAKIQGRCITKYTPPTLPKFVEKDRSSIFSFWGPATEGNKKAAFKPGDNCTTPFGTGTVVEYRPEPGIVVVDMIGWSARAYLQLDSVKAASKGRFSRFIRQLSGHETPRKSSELEFPYAKGTIIKTPFGEGVVTKPLSVPTSSKSDATPKTENVEGKGEQTLGISLNSWMLADESHPMLYCTVDTARAWKEMKESDGMSSTYLLSAFGHLVSRGLRLVVPETDKKAEEPSTPRFEQYYKDAAAVTTQYGDGVVRRFRDTDGFYEIELVNWKLANGQCATAVLQKDDISYRIAKGCHEGYPVLTSYGVSGTLASVEPTTGVHIVTIPSAGMVCYLQPEDLIRPLKAAVGEDVLTAYGEGKVVQYRLQDDMYVIELKWAKLYAKGETFDRVGDGMQDRDGRFGMSWLFRFLWYRKPRSRSNSLSLSVRSQSGRSLT